MTPHLTLEELYTRCIAVGPLPASIQRPSPAWRWSNSRGTPIWRHVPEDDVDALRAALMAEPLTPPLYLSVHAQRKGHFAPVVVDRATLMDTIARTIEPDAIVVDAQDRCVAVVTEEWEVLVLRGDASDWPTG